MKSLPPSRPGARIATHDILTITDLEGQQAVDFLCCEADNPKDRHYATNMLQLQGDIHVGQGSMLYCDRDVL
jgi:uncharacterized protein YcgI (DUF1989 family)